MSLLSLPYLIKAIPLYRTITIFCFCNSSTNPITSLSITPRAVLNSSAISLAIVLNERFPSRRDQIALPVSFMLYNSVSILPIQFSCADYVKKMNVCQSAF